MNYLIGNINNYQIDNDLFNKIKNEKKAKIRKIKNIDDQKRSILGELLLIDGLKTFYNINYDNIEINNDDKPYIKTPKYMNIKYNISHSNDYCIVVFSNNDIGVDIEKIRDVNLKTINYFATEEEKEFILQNEKEKLKRLFTIYTLKEAYLKMNGNSLLDINNVSFYHNNTLSCSDETIKFTIINKIDDYIISICEKL